MTQFTATTTAAEVVAGLDLSGKNAVITGGGSGIGAETARALASAGANVVITVRDPDQAKVAADIERDTGRTVGVRRLDLSQPESVVDFVDEWTQPLHILVNNAGVMAPPLTRTQDGHELQFGTNHLGHYLLARLLRPAFAAAEGTRIVSLSSIAHQIAPFDFDDPNFERREYERWLAYGQSKTANALFAVGAAATYADLGVVAHAVHPGRVATGLQRFVSAEEEAEVERTATSPAKSAAQGAATSVYAATAAHEAGSTGYFADCQRCDPAVTSGEHGVAPWALDAEAAERLWDLSARYVGLA